MIKLRVPATTANLGPGFDCLGLALDLWNEVTIEAAGRTSYNVEGEGAAFLNSLPDNPLLKAVRAVYEVCGVKEEGLHIRANNQIPPGSGLGSSAAAILAGLLGANERLGRPLDRLRLLQMGIALEGHPDNICAALEGGMIVSASGEGAPLYRRVAIPELRAVVVQPEVNLSTHAARALLPAAVPLKDAVFNLSRTALVVEALRAGDLDLLNRVMDDRLHQKRRLAGIPAGGAALEAARQYGAAALSGAGPSIIIFCEAGAEEAAREAVIRVFTQAGVPARGFLLKTSEVGAEVTASGQAE